MQLRYQITLACASLTVFVGHGQAQQLPVPCVACAGGITTFIQAGQAGYVVNGNVGTITQHTDRAILNWQSFNIDEGSTVNFVQPSSSSAALNRIFQNDPSRIFGALNANGHVYLINQNGILFGQHAQVNTGALVASTLNMSDRVFKELGIAGAINVSGAPEAAFDNTNDSRNNPGAVIRIAQGAKLKSDERVLIIAPHIENRGTIETPDGQAILAASENKVYVASSKELRGLLVEVDAGGSVANFGDIIAERGNITLAGLAVNQSGRVSATTSTGVNGAIRLMARDTVTIRTETGATAINTPQANRAGTLTFGEGSVTQVQLDSFSPTAADAQDQLPSSIEAMGRTIEVRSDAQLLVPGGTVALTATSTPINPLSGLDGTAKLHVAAGAVIDVSGASDTVAMERNQGRLRLFGNELADAPVQRDGPLARQDIAFDLRRGTAIANRESVDAQRATVQRSVRERMSAGGTIELGAEGDIALQPGALLDFSGGQVTYADGYLESTMLVTLDGRLVDISEANPNVTYAGFFGNTTVKYQKWGVEETFSNGALRSFKPGYIEGKDAGSASINSVAGAVGLGATLRGERIIGDLQRDATTTIEPDVNPIHRNYTEVPLAGLLSIDVAGDLTVATTAVPQSFDFTDTLDRDTPTVVALDSIVAAGINRLRVSADGIALLPEDVTLDLGAGSAVGIAGSKVTIAGDIEARSGTVDLTGLAGGAITIASTATIDARGSWVNDLRQLNGGAAGNAPLFIDGGGVTIAGVGDVTLEQGSLIDVSAGAHMTSSADVETGSAGSIRLNSAAPPTIEATTLSLSGELRGYGFDAGGELSIAAASVHISTAGAGTGTEGELALASSFFDRGGFGSYEVETDRGNFEIDTGTSIHLSPQNLLLGGGLERQATGSELSEFTTLASLLDSQRAPTSFAATVQRAEGIRDADAVLRMGSNASITTELGGAIALSSDSDLFVDGTLRAHGGSIDMALVRSRENRGIQNDPGFRADQAIWIGSHAVLDASGGAHVQIDRFNRRSGEVFPGGQVTLRAERGSIVTRAGSLIDISGAQQTFDLPLGRFGAPVATTVASDAGALNITMAENALLFGEMRAQPGGASAAGGSLNVTIDEEIRDPRSELREAVETAGAPSPFSYVPRQIEVVAKANGDIAEGTNFPTALDGRTVLSADALSEGGFDAIDLTIKHSSVPDSRQQSQLQSGIISFIGDVQLTAARRVALNAGLIVSEGGAARVAAPRVSIGLSQITFSPRDVDPAAGSGSLVVDAQHIDLVGDTVFSGFAVGGEQPAISLNSSGDIRLIGIRTAQSGNAAFNSGSITAAADITLSADQIYPSTLTAFDIKVLGPDGDPDGRIIINAGGEAQTPLSAAGRLGLSASEIVQGGVLRAPFGTIELHATERLELAPGSLMSTSGAGVTVPFGVLELGEEWVYPFPASTVLFAATPEQSVVLRAPDIALAAGSTLDISGGGDLSTYEFIKGPGGSTDILLGNNPEGSFAILPARSNVFGVFDPIQSAAAGYEPGRTITLSAGSGVPAGEYAILPARYALLPGAYLIRPVNGANNIQPATPQVLADGVTPVVAGRLGYAGTGIHDSLWSVYAVLNGAQVRERAQYNEYRASAFFAVSGGVPGDAGRLTIDAQRSIVIDGALNAAAAGGRAAQVDFVANNLAVVNARAGVANITEIVDAELANFGAASVLLGGSRSTVEDGIAVQVTAQNVTVQDGADLSGSEVLLAAKDNVTVESGARISAVAASGSVDEAKEDITYRIAGDGAFARVSSRAQATVERTSAPGAAGRVVVEEGATLNAARSLTLEASRDVTSFGDLLTNNGSLSLTASLISVGETPADTNGLVLSNNELARFQADELLLRSRSTIDFYGTINAGLNRAVLDANGLRGFDDGSVSAVNVAASELVLRNSGTATAVTPGTATGSLVLSTGTLTLDAGKVDISGFSDTRLVAAREFVANPTYTLENGTPTLGDAVTTLQVHGDLSIETPRLTTGAGATAEIKVDGALATAALTAPADLAAVTAMGGKLALKGTSVTHATRIDMPTGIVTLEATEPGGVVLASGSSIDVGGRDVDFTLKVVGSPGGVVQLIADEGTVSIGDQVVIDVTGAPSGGDAGRLTIHAAGDAQIASSASLRGAATVGARQGAFELNANALPAGFSALNAALNAGRFNERRALTLATGDLVIAANETVDAHEFELAVEGGRLDVAGTINAAGSEGGRVRLSARDQLTLQASAHIDARATADDENGGEVELAVGDNGRIVLNGASIDVTGTDADGDALASGYVRLRAPSVGVDGVGITALSGTFAGAERIYIEAFRAYASDGDGVTVSDGVIDAADIAAMRTHTDTHMANAAGIETALGVAADERFHLLPGVEVRSPGDLTLTAAWDLMQWRYGADAESTGDAGVLTLRAGGDLNLVQSISDGFATEFVNDPFGIPERDVVQRGESWTYRLAGGSNTAAADPLATAHAQSGSVIVGSDVHVRTGTGEIDVVAAANVKLQTATSSIYTVGENRGSGVLDPIDQEILLRADFVHNGGDIRVRAGHNVQGVSDRYYADWVPRLAAKDFLFYGRNPELEVPTSWAIDASKFTQGIGTLGGGDIAITAGDDMTSLTLALPTNGQPNAQDGSNLRVAGGGDLRVDVGGNIEGGLYSLGRGSADIRAGGSITDAVSGTRRLFPILHVADTRFLLQARTNVALETVFNPTLAGPVSEQAAPGFLFGDLSTYFSTYSDDSAVSLTAVSGDVVLGARKVSVLDPRQQSPLEGTYPGTLLVHSLQADVRQADFDFDQLPELRLLPAPSGTLELLAGRDLLLSSPIYVSDADLSFVPSVERPMIEGISDLGRFDLSNGHAPIPVHFNDVVPVLIAANRDIRSIPSAENGQPPTVSLSKAAEVFAGRDISNLRLSVQHSRPTEATVVEAGRDIKYPINRTSSGRISTNSFGGVELAGPGRLDVIAGRDLDLGVAQGIQTVGNRFNPVLADGGADINIWTGQATRADFDAFIDKYMTTSGEYADELHAYLRSFEVDANLSDMQNFKALSRADQRAFVQQVFFAEIKKGGLNGFQAGYDAIAALFPEKDAYEGDLTAYLSYIRTLDGGNINLVVPNGSINAGLASSVDVPKQPGEIGVIAQGLGDINVFVHEDLLVNASRVFSLDGGDILAWSSTGDIDAGRGSKAALSIPPPVVSIDPQTGVATVELPPSVQGSGIRAGVSTPGRKPGDVFLFAPQGVVDAGDAGIVSAGNITIVATEVIGADNIEFGGVAVGIPTDTGGLGASLQGASSVAESATKSVAGSLGPNSGADEKPTQLADTALSWLEVFIVGLGEEGCKQDDMACLKRQKTP